MYLQVVFLSELSMGEQAVASLLSILSSKETLLDQPSVEDHSESIISPSPAARILAELKTRWVFKPINCEVGLSKNRRRPSLQSVGS